MTELERALLHIKTRADAWAVKVVKDALSQEPTFDDECQKDMDEAWEQIQKKRKRIPVTLDLTPCDDAISRILKRMWNCRGKHTTSIDKVKMEQIIRDELPSVTQKSGKWMAHSDGGIWIKYYECSKCGKVHDTHSDFCPNCGADMREEQTE